LNYSQNQAQNSLLQQALRQRGGYGGYNGVGSEPYPGYNAEVGLG
jgi:hypothetical protein